MKKKRIMCNPGFCRTIDDFRQVTFSAAPLIMLVKSISLGASTVVMVVASAASTLETTNI